MYPTYRYCVFIYSVKLETSLFYSPWSFVCVVATCSMYMYFKPWRCSEYDRVRTVNISASNRNGHLHVHAIHVIHMLIQFMSHYSCDRGYSENYLFSLFVHCFRYAMSFRKQAKSGNWDACWWDVRQGSRASVRVLSEDDAAWYQQTGAVHDRQRPGRPRVTTARADCDITLTYLRQLAATVTARKYGV